MDEVTNEVEQQEQKQPEVRTFTQEEVDEIVSKRIARERKNLPTSEELTEFREWKKSKTPQDDSATRDDLDSALAEMEMTRRENYLLRQGIDPDDVDYYVYKISKSMDGETDFEDAAKEFLKTHKKSKSAVTIDTGARLNAGNAKRSPNDEMNALIRGAKN